MGECKLENVQCKLDWNSAFHINQFEKKVKRLEAPCPGQDVGKLGTLTAGVSTGPTSMESNLANS